MIWNSDTVLASYWAIPNLSLSADVHMHESRDHLFRCLHAEGQLLRLDRADQRADTVGGTGAGLILLFGDTPDIFVLAIAGQLSRCHGLAELLLAAR